MQQKGTIKSQYIPYYVKWVSECYFFLNVSNENYISSSQKQQFLLEFNGTIVPFLVPQILGSVPLFPRYFPAEKTLFHVGDNDYFKTVAIWQVMSEKTEKVFGEMWEAAKKLRKK